MSTCIPQHLIEEIKKLDLNVSTQERNKLLGQFFDEQTANNISKQFERSLLLKKQETALNHFIDNLSEIGAEKKLALKEKLAKELQRKRELMYNSDGTINPNFEALAGRTDTEIQDFVKSAIDKKYKRLRH